MNIQKLYVREVRITDNLYMVKWSLPHFILLHLVSKTDNSKILSPLMLKRVDSVHYPSFSLIPDIRCFWFHFV